MKRLFILSAAVAALASCSNSEVITEVNEPQVPDKAIAFETFSSNATRGAGDPSENSGQTETDGLEGHHETFKVWGYKDVQTDYVFKGVTVSYTDPTAESQSGSWNYSPIHFWDKNANSYEFYACAPEGADFTLNTPTSSATQANDYFTLSEVTLKNVTSSEATYVQSLKDKQVINNRVNESGETISRSISYGDDEANTDYMIANACKVANNNFGDPVQLHFNHILSRLNIAVKKGTGLQGNGIKVKLNSLTVNNLVANGKFNESDASENLASGTNNRWTREITRYVSYVANPLAKENNAAQGDNSNLVESDEKYVLQSLVMPQTVIYESVRRDGLDISNGSAPYLQLVYTIVNDTYKETFKACFNLAAAFGANATNNTIAFNEGWQNTLHITIDAKQITFDPDVYRWMVKENKDFNAESGTSSNHLPNP